MAPPDFEIIFILFLRFFETAMNFWIKKPDKINGIAKPKEYDVKSKIPLVKVISNAAKANIDPRIGPIHGVQPKPKAIPTRTGYNLFDLLSVWNLFSIFKNLKLKRPKSCNENNIMIAPETILSSKELVNTKLPIKVLVAPKAINTIEKPIVKSTVGIMFTRLLSNSSFKVLPET